MSSKTPRPPKAFPFTAQVAIIAALCAVVLFVLLSAAAVKRLLTPAATPTPKPLPAGFFQATDLEWQGLKFANVRVLDFPSESQTEGTVAAADDATTQVFSPFSGRVTRVFATTGDYVSAGSPLFAGEATEYAQAQNDLATAAQTLRAARVQLGVTRANRTRLLALLRVEGAARKDVEQSAADLATAQAAVRNAEIAADLARSHLEILGAQGGRGATGPHMVVPAPIGGVVTQRSVGVGQNVESAASGASNALFTITDFSKVYFVADVREVDAPVVHVGDRVLVRLLAFPGRLFSANVRYIAPSIDPDTHRVLVRAEVTNPDGGLRPGMFGTFSILTGPQASHIGVPSDAVIYEGDTARVWIVGPNRTLALRHIEVGRTREGFVEVLNGLHNGERVVTSGAVFIDQAEQGNE